MSFSNILSSNDVEDTKPPLIAMEPVVEEARKAAKMLNGDASSAKPSTPVAAPAPRKAGRPSPSKDEKPRRETARAKPAKQPVPKKESPATSKEEEKIRKALAEIDAKDHSDPEGPGFEEFRQKCIQAGAKRIKTVADGDAERRKVSPTFEP